MPGTLTDQELMHEENRLGSDGAYTAGTEELQEGNQ
jgi:hypothetical protein